MKNAVHIIKTVSTVKHIKNGLMGQCVNQKHNVLTTRDAPFGI